MSNASMNLKQSTEGVQRSGKVGYVEISVIGDQRLEIRQGVRFTERLGVGDQRSEKVGYVERSVVGDQRSEIRQGGMYREIYSRDSNKERLGD